MVVIDSTGTREETAAKVVAEVMNHRRCAHVAARMIVPVLPSPGRRSATFTHDHVVELSQPQRLAFAAFAAATRQREAPSPTGGPTSLAVGARTYVTWNPGEARPSFGVNIRSFGFLLRTGLVTRAANHYHLTDAGRELAALWSDDVDAFFAQVHAPGGSRP